jgi:glycosyltransferase involved in cell wall biosynthesis
MGKSLKIAVTNLWNDSGGGTRVALQIANILLEEGHRVDLHSLGGPQIELLDRVHGTSLTPHIGKNLKVKYYLVRGIQRRILPKITISALKLFCKIVTEILSHRRYDVVFLFDDLPNINFERTDSTIVLYSHFPLAARIVYNIYDELDTDPEYYKYFVNARLAKERVKRKLLKNLFHIGSTSDLNNVKIVANSTVTSIFAKKIWGRVDQIIYPPVNNSPSFHREFEKKENIVITLGVVSPNKYHGVVIDAFSRVRSGKLIVMGALVDNRYLSFLFKKIKTLNLENRVYIAYNVPENIKWNILLKSKALAHAKRFEPFGIAVAEAMSTGTIPIVYKGSASGSWIDIIDRGRYGLGFESVEELKEKIEYVLTLGQEDLKYFMEKCIERARAFSLNKFKEKLLNVTYS